MNQTPTQSNKVGLMNQTPKELEKGDCPLFISFYSIKKRRKSMTLVWVGPVRINLLAFLKKLYESLLARYSSGSRDKSCIIFSMEGVIHAPAASVGPSMPSVPMLSINHLAFSRRVFFISNRAAKVNSWFRPPSPFPLTVTVSSPPAKRHKGRKAASSAWRIFRKRET